MSRQHVVEELYQGERLRAGIADHFLPRYQRIAAVPTTRPEHTRRGSRRAS